MRDGVPRTDVPQRGDVDVHCVQPGVPHGLHGGGSDRVSAWDGDVGADGSILRVRARGQPAERDGGVPCGVWGGDVRGRQRDLPQLLVVVSAGAWVPWAVVAGLQRVLGGQLCRPGLPGATPTILPFRPKNSFLFRFRALYLDFCSPFLLTAGVSVVRLVVRGVAGLRRGGGVAVRAVCRGAQGRGVRAELHAVPDKLLRGRRGQRDPVCPLPP